MNIDKETPIGYFNVVLDDSPAVLKKLREQAKEDGQNDNGEKKLSIRETFGNFEPSEYYFDSDDGLFISGEFVSTEGKVYLCLTIPLSDKVLIDILEYSVKKLNKLKTALETLK